MEPRHRESSTQMTDSQQRLDSSQIGPTEIDLPSSPIANNEPLNTPRVNGVAHPTQFVSPLGETHLKADDVEMSSPPPETTQYDPVIDLNGNSQSTSSAQSQGVKRAYDEYFDPNDAPPAEEDQGESQHTEKSFVSTLSMRHSIQRREAYYDMLHNSGGNWSGFGLLSTDGGHGVVEKEL